MPLFVTFDGVILFQPPFTAKKEDGLTNDTAATQREESPRRHLRTNERVFFPHDSNTVILKTYETAFGQKKNNNNKQTKTIRNL